jgi:hypothetical protein
MGEVGGVEGQLEGELVVEMDVGEDPLLAGLADPLVLDVVDEPLGLERRADGFGAVGEQVQVDVRALADVAGERAPDQPGAEDAEHPHQAQRRQSHPPQILRPPLAFVHPGESLDLVADFAVARQVARLDVAAADSPGGLHLGSKVLRFVSGVHQSGRLEGDPTSQSLARHVRLRRHQAHQRGAGLCLQ